MVRSALADEQLLSYFTNISKQNNFSIGLILGQHVDGKDYIIHFAKTPPFHAENSKESLRLKNINDVNAEWVADHARQTTRMLPGGMHVLGLFVVAPEDLLNPFSSKLKGILNQVHKSVIEKKYLYGSPQTSEKLIMNYCSKTHQYSYKTYDVGTNSVKPAEFKFLPNAAIKWVQIECKYLMDQVHNIGPAEGHWPLKKHMGIILEKVSRNLEASVFLYDSELKEGAENIESIGKKKASRSNKSANSDDFSKPIQVCILEPCENTDLTPKFELSDSGNKIKIYGHVACKLWLNPKVSIKAASEALIQDVLRSLSTRFEMHWDSLTEEEHGEDINSVHEPPRRVLVPLPNCNIAISDYLFPGEGPQDAQISLEELFDFKIHSESEVLEVEGQADLTDYYNEGLEADSGDIVVKSPKEINRSFFILGLVAALLVLIISLVVHFTQQA